MSEADPLEVGPPHSPEGYGPPSRFTYPLLVLVLGAALVIPLAAVAFGTLLIRIQGPLAFESVVTITPAPEEALVVDVLGFVGPLAVALVATTVVHEWVHGLVFEYYGYDVSYGVAPQMGAAYAVAFGQFQTRVHTLRVGVAPLVVIDLLALAFLLVPVPVVAFTAFLVLVVNTAGAVGDIYLLWRAWRLPPGTLFYDADLRHSYVFEPLGRGD